MFLACLSLSVVERVETGLISLVEQKVVLRLPVLHLKCSQCGDEIELELALLQVQNR